MAKPKKVRTKRTSKNITQPSPTSQTPRPKKTGVPRLEDMPSVAVSEVEKKQEQQWFERLDQAKEWWKHFDKLVGMLIRFGETAAQSSDGTKAFVFKSLGKQFEEIRRALVQLDRVPPHMELLLAIVRDVGHGGDSEAFQWLIRRAISIIGSLDPRYDDDELLQAFDEAVSPELDVKWSEFNTQTADELLRAGDFPKRTPNNEKSVESIAPKGSPGRKPDPASVDHAKRVNELLCQSPRPSWKAVKTTVNTQFNLEGEAAYTWRQLYELHRYHHGDKAKKNRGGKVGT